MIYRLTTLFVLLAVLLGTAGAQTRTAQPPSGSSAVSGVVTNRTTGAPAAGVEVVLVDPMQGMAEVAKTTADAQGRYTLRGSAAQGPRLVRATRDGVTYFRMVTPGTDSVAVDVYDAAKKVDGIEGTANVFRVQTDGSNLQVSQLFAIENASAPPRTLNGANTLEFVLPEGAQLDGADAQGPNGQPISVIPQELPQKGRYAFQYPLKPGETRFQISYRMPYKGSASLAAVSPRAWRHFVLLVAPGMSWTPRDPSVFQAMNDPTQNGTLQVATNTKPGQELAFQISGSGVFGSDQAAQAGGGAPNAGAANNRPGGGMAPPIDAPDALARYRWMILGVLGVVLGGCAYLSVSRNPHGSMQEPEAGFEPEPAAPPTKISTALAAPVPGSTKLPQVSAEQHGAGPGAPDPLMESIKQELFQLEVDRQQGAIPPAEYEQQKAALDRMLQRALSRRKG